MDYMKHKASFLAWEILWMVGQFCLCLLLHTSFSLLLNPLLTSLQYLLSIRCVLDVGGTWRELETTETLHSKNSPSSGTEICKKWQSKMTRSLIEGLTRLQMRMCPNFGDRARWEKAKKGRPFYEFLVICLIAEDAEDCNRSTCGKAWKIPCAE